MEMAKRFDKNFKVVKYNRSVFYLFAMEYWKKAVETKYKVFIF